MTTSLYLQYVLMYILGQALHLFTIKIPAVRKRDKAANLDFSFKDYWSQEWSIIIGNQVLGAMLVLGFDEIKHWRPDILEFAKFAFAFVGIVGSVAIMSWFSTYEKKVLGIIDTKTNIGDENTAAPVTKVSEITTKTNV